MLFLDFEMKHWEAMVNTFIKQNGCRDLPEWELITEELSKDVMQPLTREIQKELLEGALESLTLIVLLQAKVWCPETPLNLNYVLILAKKL